MTQNIFSAKKDESGESQGLLVPHARLSLVLSMVSIASCWFFGLGLFPAVAALVISLVQRSRYARMQGIYAKSSFVTLKIAAYCALFGVIGNLIWIAFLSIYFFVL